MTTSFEVTLRNIALMLIIGRHLYWFVTEHKANKEKPKTHERSLTEIVRRGFTTVLGFIIVLQLLGLDFLSFSNAQLLHIIGFILVVVAVIISILARKELGTNWAHAAEYQIKKNHQLVTRGIYKYIRHPIYTGIVVSYLGVELLVGSYLFFVLLGLIITAYFQSKKEEKILIKEFGQSYKDYMKNSKMFIPFIW